MANDSLAEILQRSARRCREADAPLAERLKLFADDVRSLSPDFAEVVERMIGRLQSSGAGLTAPSTGELMPPFLLPNQDGELVSLEQLLAQGPLVIAFHRGHWCPYCRINADALAKLYPTIAGLGAQIVAITPEVEHFTSELKSDSKAPFPILTDLDNGYALALNLAVWIDDEKRAAMIAIPFLDRSTLPARWCRPMATSSASAGSWSIRVASCRGTSTRNARH